MQSILYTKNRRRRFLRTAAAGAVCAMTVCVLTGCGISGERGYTQEEPGNLAKLEIYEAGSDTLIKTVEDEEILYGYNQSFSISGEDKDSYAAGKSAPEYSESEEGALKERAEEAEETYHIMVYKHPAAKFGAKEPVKILTMTLYENTNIVKIAVMQDAVKSMPLPEELLTFYCEMSEEESAFYESVLP